MDNNINIKFGLVPPVPGTEVRDLIEFVSNCEKGGFDSVWFPDHMLFMANRITPEVWSVITAASVVTERIHMGAIGDPHRIHPAVLAQRLATIDHISGGRIFACLGYGEKMNLDYYGIHWNKPLSRLRESVEIIKGFFNGDKLDFHGEFFNLENAEIRIRPVNNSGVPVYIAATGPNSLKVAGQIGDGWITNAMPEELFSEKAKTVLSNINRTDVKKFDKGIYIFLSVSENADEAYSRLDSIKHAIIWPELLGQAGFDIKIDDKFTGLEYTKIMPSDEDMIQRFREMGDRYYSREVVEKFVLCGTPEDIVKRLESYIDSGVDHFILRDFSPDREYSFNMLKERIIPRFRESGS